MHRELVYNETPAATSSLLLEPMHLLISGVLDF